MENNIVDFNEYKKKKASEEKMKNLDIPFDDGFFLDDDEAFEDSAEMYDKVKDLANVMIDNVSAVLFDREEFSSIEEYYNALNDNAKYLLSHKPTKGNKEEFEQWNTEFSNIQASIFYSTLIDSLLQRSDEDDEQIRKLITDGSLMESDLLTDVGDNYQEVERIMLLFNSLMREVRSGLPSDEFILKVRRLTFSLIAKLDQEYEQLLKEEPPAGNPLMHSKWKDALVENRARRNIVRMSKASLICFLDSERNNNPLVSPDDILRNLLNSPAFSEQNSDIAPVLFPNIDDLDDLDELWDDDDDSEWDDDEMDDEDWEDEDDEYFEGDYDYWKLYPGANIEIDDDDDDDD